MTATTLSRAASAASVHSNSINREQKEMRASGAYRGARSSANSPMLDRSPVRTKAVTTRATSNTGAADATVGRHRRPSSTRACPQAERSIGVRRASPAPANTQPTQRAVDWSEIATGLNRTGRPETPVRTNAR